MCEDRRRVVLVGVVGMSPAVLTETVWALAHEDEPLLVDEVVAITTSSGQKAIREELLQMGAWQRLKDALLAEGCPVDDKLSFGATDSIRVLGDGNHDFEDIASPQENDFSGDFILRVLRQYTENSDTRVIASIAGGRKTMSALMLSCMSLLGREEDRVCHVLVNPPYDQRLEPPFFFPEKGVTHQLNGKKYISKKAKPILSDISFVRVRGWYEQESGQQPASYRHMVSLFRKSALPAVNYPAVVVDCERGEIAVGGDCVKLAGGQFALFYVMIQRIKRNDLPRSWNDILDDMDEVADAGKAPFDCEWWHNFKAKGVDVEQFNRWANHARSKLSKVMDKRLCEALLPKFKGARPPLFPKRKIKIKRDWISADIQKNTS